MRHLNGLFFEFKEMDRYPWFQCCKISFSGLISVALYQGMSYQECENADK
jgi:hypothetical protein